MLPQNPWKSEVKPVEMHILRDLLSDSEKQPELFPG